MFSLMVCGMTVIYETRTQGYMGALHSLTQTYRKQILKTHVQSRPFVLLNKSPVVTTRGQESIKILSCPFVSHPLMVLLPKVQKNTVYPHF